MSLRSRYSLLTLLLLTAAIAVGIKLWRGPHEQRVFDPALVTYPQNAPSPSDAKLLEQMPVRPYICGGSSGWHRYIYKNTFQGPEVILVSGQPTEAHCIIFETSSTEGHFWIVPKKSNDEAPINDGLPPMELLGWVQGEPGKLNQNKRWQSMFHGHFMVSAPYHKFQREHSPVYLLTKKRDVFQVVSKRTLAIQLELVDLRSIPNADVRAWINTEFAKL